MTNNTTLVNTITMRLVRVQTSPGMSNEVGTVATVKTYRLARLTPPLQKPGG
jgi:hypothetical protein